MAEMALPGTAARPARLAGAPRRGATGGRLFWPGFPGYGYDHQGPHHVVLFVLQDMAVPDVFVAAGPGAQQVIVIGARSPHGRIWRQGEGHGHPGHLPGIHSDRLLPAPFIRVRGRGVPILVNRPNLTTKGWRESTWTFTR